MQWSFNKLQFYFIQAIQFMTETEILKPKTSHKLIIYDDGENNFRLPRIENPKSRGNLQSKAQARKNTPPLLPNIKQNLLNLNNNNEEKPQAKANDPLIDNQKDDFALEIQEKLRLILENVNQGEQIQQYDNDDQEIDFEEAIQQNKEKLKQQKQQKAQSNNIIIEKPVKIEKKQNKTKSKTLKNKYQNNIYEKRMKQYRDISNENKFIQKKKELILQKQQVLEKGLKANIKGKDDSNIGNYHSGMKVIQGQGNKDKERGSLRPKFSAKSLKEEDIQRIHYQNAKSANLFDNIHNFLQNPMKNRPPNQIRKFSRTNLKNLEQQIKQINQKLGMGPIQNSEDELKANIQQKTVLDWKRLQYNRGSNFRCHYDSNFQKQVDRIGSLQQKNSNYLTKLIDHQKTLVQLSLIKKSHNFKHENE